MLLLPCHKPSPAVTCQQFHIRYLLRSAVRRQSVPQNAGSNCTSRCSWMTTFAAPSVVECTTTSTRSKSCSVQGRSFAFAFASASGCNAILASALHLVYLHSDVQVLVLRVVKEFPFSLTAPTGVAAHGAWEASAPCCRRNSDPHEHTCRSWSTFRHFLSPPGCRSAAQQRCCLR